MIELIGNKESGVFYIDGSCRPTVPGNIGWGIHGYFYNEKTDKPVNYDLFTHTTHGYTLSSLGVKDSVAHVTPTGYIDGLGSHEQFASNNVAEILGLQNLLYYLKDKCLDTVRIYTDSEYLKNCMNNLCPRWVKNGWLRQDGTPAANRVELEETYEIFKTMKGRTELLELHWIRSHNGDLGNERADLLAGIASSYSQNRKDIHRVQHSDVKGYWKTDIEKNPYIAFRKLYFNSVQEYNRPGIYYLTESTDPDFVIGKANPSTGYSVIYLNEPDPIIEEIKLKQFEVSRGINAIILMKLDSVYSKYVYPWLVEHGSNPIISQKHSHSMNLVDKKPITIEMNPTGLSLRTLEYLSLMEDMLSGFEEHNNPDSTWLIGATEIKIKNITDEFFVDLVDKKQKVKKELKPEFIVGFRNLPILLEIEHNGKPLKVKIQYILGYDCLPRNNLKHLENLEPTIYLLTWKDNSILRYATIIKSKLGIGIWSNYFSNQVVLPE